MLIVTFGSTSSGSSSQTHGYSAGHVSYAGPQVFSNVIQKVSFAVAEADSTDVANLTVARTSAGGATAINEQYGYCVAGHHTIPSSINTIDKYPFASDSDATDVGDVNVNTSPNGNISSVTHGYYTADPGTANGALAGNINRFAFASPATSADVGDMITNPANGGGSQSETHGYISGGAGNSNQIQKFSFASLGNATDVGDMLHGGNGPACASSTTHNYNAGGWQSEQNPTNQINKWTTAQDNNATDVGDLWAPNYGNVGTQV